MSDGLVNIVEHKILQGMAISKIDYNGPIVDKIQEVKNKTFQVDKKDWDQIEFENLIQKEKRSLQKSNTVFNEHKNAKQFF